MKTLVTEAETQKSNPAQKYYGCNLTQVHFIKQLLYRVF
jgi:hypothetical protein